jgi:hypothetical protein
MSDPSGWQPDSPAWVTHHAMQEENCRLRTDREALLAALDALSTGLQEVITGHLQLADECTTPTGQAHQRGLADGKIAVRQELLAILAKHQEPTR